MTSGISQPNFPPPRPSISEITCFSYGEKEYGIMNCAKVAELIRDGLLARDNIERLIKIEQGSRDSIGNLLFRLPNVKGVNQLEVI